MGAQIREMARGHEILVASERREEVMRQLLDAEAQITRVQPLRESLEDLFVREADDHDVA